MNNRICFLCATIYKSSNDIMTCPSCGEKISKTEYEKVLRKVSRSVRYGWLYRKVYEKCLQENGELNTRLCLKEAPEIINFIALAAISGIIGNISTDIVKKIISKIKVQINQRKSRHSEQDSLNIIYNEEEMEKFIKYIREFYECFDMLEEPIKKAIYEEIIVDKISTSLEKYVRLFTLDSSIENLNQEMKEQLCKSVININDYIESEMKFKPNDVIDFWKNIDNKKS